MSKSKDEAKTTEETEVKGIFHKFYGAAKEEFEKRKKPFVENAIKRKFQEYIDKCSISINEKEEKIFTSSSTNFENYDVNTIISLRYDIEKLTKQINLAKEEYKNLLGEDYKL